MAPHVQHSDIVRFGNEVVNLHQDRVRRYRKQVNDLRDRLAAKIRDNPDFALVKMLHSGSVAKGTALSTINDMDVAVYVRKADAPGDDSELLSGLTGWLTVFGKRTPTCTLSNSALEPIVSPSTSAVVVWM